jgi:hypothetical protein
VKLTPAERSKLWRLKYPDRFEASKKRWSLLHPGKQIEYNRKYREKLKLNNQANEKIA